MTDIWFVHAPGSRMYQRGRGALVGTGRTSTFAMCGRRETLNRRTHPIRVLGS
jgi:hypothetical protein